MGIQRVEVFRRDGYARVDPWCFYAAFMEPEPGDGLVKLGISVAPLKRLYDIHCGSPYPIKAGLFTHVGLRNRAASIEHRLRHAFADRNTRGEWYRFDYSSLEDKQLFNQSCRKAFAKATGRMLSWRQVNIETLADDSRIRWIQRRS